MPQNKRTTSKSDPVAVPEQASPQLPEQQTFHEHLRALTRSAVRVVIEEVMREELKQRPGEKQPLSAKATVMGPTHAIWPLLLV
jgi:hypothetical protein